MVNVHSPSEFLTVNPTNGTPVFLFLKDFLVLFESDSKERLQFVIQELIRIFSFPFSLRCFEFFRVLSFPFGTGLLDLLRI